ncbi:hypothetical protein [Lentibacillus amyloliquefaciens]|uniref:Uncharacterized protein n=1 Tax=Lentibacillus amyloliquefaciens TaxID=1472767 RepID=A0A0U3W2Y7_9BACI|nr:hypothetical protein [Lentibacillus amyloliquefaciens]ALX47538.1 hypothetical protein AOX59_02315 [Lentibacillus amyloliquefaciens]
MSNNGFGKAMDKDQDKDVKQDDKTTTKDAAETTKKESSSKRSRRPVKPEGFKEFEALAKGIIEADGSSYYEWLHERHQDIILNFNVSNQKQITNVAKKGE